MCHTILTAKVSLHTGKSVNRSAPSLCSAQFGSWGRQRSFWVSCKGVTQCWDVLTDWPLLWAIKRWGERKSRKSGVEQRAAWNTELTVIRTGSSRVGGLEWERQRRHHSRAEQHKCKTQFHFAFCRYRPECHQNLITCSLSHYQHWHQDLTFTSVLCKYLEYTPYRRLLDSALCHKVWFCEIWQGLGFFQRDKAAERLMVIFWWGQMRPSATFLLSLLGCSPPHYCLLHKQTRPAPEGLLRQAQSRQAKPPTSDGPKI